MPTCIGQQAAGELETFETSKVRTSLSIRSVRLINLFAYAPSFSLKRSGGMRRCTGRMARFAGKRLPNCLDRQKPPDRPPGSWPKRAIYWNFQILIIITEKFVLRS